MCKGKASIREKKKKKKKKILKKKKKILKKKKKILKKKKKILKNLIKWSLVCTHTFLLFCFHISICYTNFTSFSMNVYVVHSILHFHILHFYLLHPLSKRAAKTDYL